MLPTPLLHKPIAYGSDLANWAVWLLIMVHLLPALVAPIAAIVAFATKKGSRLHLAAGRWFVRSMAAVASTGIVIDVIRMSFCVEENHTKYAGYSMPSSYPARLGFLYVAVCVLYLLAESTPPSVFRLRASSDARRVWLAPTALLAAGFGLILLVALRYNPWTGALWMIFTFMPIVYLAARGRSRVTQRAGGVAQHRFGMALLAAFSWWGALQGFGPAIGIAVKGDDPSTAPYVGNQPGNFSPTIFFFLVSWGPLFALGAFLIRRFRRLAAARAAASAQNSLA